MRFSASTVSITISIHDGDAFVNMIPPASANCQPHCEIIEMADMPTDVRAYIDQMERKERQGQ